MSELQADRNILTVLGRIEATLDHVAESSKAQEEKITNILDRMARLEESTKGTAPKLQDLAIDVQDHEHRIDNLEKFQGDHCKEHDDIKSTTGNRTWEVWKLVLGPILASLMTWILIKAGWGGVTK